MEGFVFVKGGGKGMVTEWWGLFLTVVEIGHGCWND